MTRFGFFLGWAAGELVVVDELICSCLDRVLKGTAMLVVPATALREWLSA